MKNGAGTKKPIDKGEQRLIYLKWLDAYSDGGWKTPQQVCEFINHEDCICENVGWLVYEDENTIVISARRLCWSDPKEETYEFGLFQKIPKPWIKHRKYLK